MQFQILDAVDSPLAVMDVTLESDGNFFRIKFGNTEVEEWFGTEKEAKVRLDEIKRKVGVEK